MSEMQRLRKYFDDAVARALRKRQLPGELGKAPGVSDASNFTVPGKPGYTWVRVTSGDGVTVVPAINHVVANKPDVPVWVEPNEGGVYEVTRIRAEDFLVFSGGATLPNTSAAPTANAPTTARRLVPGLVVHESGLTVRIQAFHYRYGVQSRYYPGGTLDLTSYVPTTSNRQVWCKVGVDPVSNSAAAVVGAEQVATVPLLDEALAAVDFSLYIPLAGVKLKAGDTSLASAARFADCRPWWTVQAEPLGIHAATTLTIAGDLVTATQTAHVLAAESGTADDLATLTAVGENTFVLLKADTGHTITVKHGTGNIALNGGADFVLNGDTTLLLYYDGSVWADVGAGGGAGGGVSALDDLSDVDLSTTPPTDGQVLVYDDASGLWLPGPGGSGGTDAAALHDNVAGEIAAIAAKTTPVSADLVVIEDSEASNAKKKVQLANLPVAGLPVYGTPANDDRLVYNSSGLLPYGAPFTEERDAASTSSGTYAFNHPFVLDVGQDLVLDSLELKLISYPGGSVQILASDQTTVLATSSVAAGGTGWITFSFASPVPLYGGTAYYTKCATVSRIYYINDTTEDLGYITLSNAVGQTWMVGHRFNLRLASPTAGVLWTPEWVAAPASASAPGTPGQKAYDANYLYLCVAADTWKRVGLATW